MADSTLTAHTVQFTDIVRHLIRLRQHFKVKAMVPQHVAQAKARFEKIFPKDRGGSEADYDLLYSIGAILSRGPGPMTMGELSQALDVPLSTATRIVDLLVKTDYARRLPDSNDRRIVRVALTETGQGLYQAIGEFIRKRVEKLLRHFTPEEREHLVALLRKLVQALEEEA